MHIFQCSEGVGAFSDFFVLFWGGGESQSITYSLMNQVDSLAGQVASRLSRSLFKYRT
jgi:hypothetical protein